MHSNNNFTRSDVKKLQKIIEINTVSPILNFIKNSLDNIKYDKVTLVRVVSDLQNLFRDFKSDYKKNPLQKLDRNIYY